MQTLWLDLKAPFAAFRWMQAGKYRASLPVLPPSAAWGLVLNLAGVETRLDSPDGQTQIRPDAPPLQLCVGVLGEVERDALYQQLHNYPVGNTGKALKDGTQGAKYNIAPVRRDILGQVALVLGVRGDAELLRRVEQGLEGAWNEDRYGLPFAGDNNFFFERLEVVEAPPAARWYRQMSPDEPPARGSCRLTIGIDRSDAARTTRGLFAPTAPTQTPPESAWVWVPKAPEQKGA